MKTPHRALALTLLLAGSACAHQSGASSGGVVQAGASARASAPRSPIAGARQLLLVTTPAWDSTSGTLRRYARLGVGAPWRLVGAAVPIVVGRTGLAWDDALGLVKPGEPVKHEGDGRSPAGAFALDTAFGFQIRQAVPWVRLPYLQLREGTECVDDSASEHYNTIVDRGAVSRVDWSSAERMRTIDQYQLGVHVSYNGAPPRRGRGSCIFLHVWSGPRSSTAGCTAMELDQLQAIVGWLDPSARPMLVQLTREAMENVRDSWGLP